MSVMGLGFGLGNISSTKNMLKYYNESSFANTILSTVDIIGKALYTFLGFIIANDEFKNADDRHYFPLAISQRFFNFILFQIVLIGSTSLISVLMIFKEKKEVVLKSNYNVLIENAARNYWGSLYFAYVVITYRSFRLRSKEKIHCGGCECNQFFLFVNELHGFLCLFSQKRK